jgi:hypothetical protein
MPQLRGLDCLDGTPLINLNPDRASATEYLPRFHPVEWLSRHAMPAWEQHILSQG